MLFILTNSLLELKTFILMAKFELKFLDNQLETDFIKVKVSDRFQYDSGNLIEIMVSITDGPDSYIYLDKSTAIKFAKTLRTEINKITESEVNNG